MMYAGYRWFLKQEAGQWTWRVVGRDDQMVLTQGVARSRAEAAACLVRAMSLGVIGGQDRVAA